MDPNATALTLLEAASYNGRGVAALVTAFDMGDRYGYGANLYEYLGSNPWGRSDPMGLAWDPFEVVDDYLEDSTASQVAVFQGIDYVLSGYNPKSVWDKLDQYLAPSFRCDPRALRSLLLNTLSVTGIPVVSQMADVTLLMTGEMGWGEFLVSTALGFVPGGKIAVAGSKLMVLGLRIGTKSRLIYKATRAVGVTGAQWHHLIPRFLGGWIEDGMAIAMKSSDHTTFHRILREHLGRQFPGRGNWSREQWMDWMSADLDNSLGVFEALSRVTDEFDRVCPGYELARHLWNEVKRQRWPF